MGVVLVRMVSWLLLLVGRFFFVVFIEIVFYLIVGLLMWCSFLFLFWVRRVFRDSVLFMWYLGW